MSFAAGRCDPRQAGEPGPMTLDPLDHASEWRLPRPTKAGIKKWSGKKIWGQLHGKGTLSDASKRFEWTPTDSS